MSDFLCRTSDKGPHFLHVHDEPYFHADLMRHAGMGWKLKENFCQARGIPWLSGDPGCKPFQVLNLTVTDPNTNGTVPNEYRDDHHTQLIPISDLGAVSYDLNAVRDQIQDALAMGAEFLGYGDFVDAFVKHPLGKRTVLGYRPELRYIYQDERGDL